MFENVSEIVGRSQNNQDLLFYRSRVNTLFKAHCNDSGETYLKTVESINKNCLRTYTTTNTTLLAVAVVTGVAIVLKTTK